MYTRGIWKEDKNDLTDNKLFTAQILKESQHYFSKADARQKKGKRQLEITEFAIRKR